MRLPRVRFRHACVWPGTAARQQGASMLEPLIAIPVLFMVGLCVLQVVLIFQARQALNFALIEAVRAGSVGHAAPQAIRSGLARGLMPWLYGAGTPSEYQANLGKSLLHVQAGEAVGWLMLQQLSPTSASFDDWAQAARDANGGVLEGVREIPNDNLRIRSATMLPNVGPATGSQGAPPIGPASGQTLADANVLKLTLDYGVPLVVPIAGRLLSSSLGYLSGCDPKANPVGGVGANTRLTPGSLTIACTLLRTQPAIGETGSVSYRLPIRVTALMRMQSPPRESADAASSLALQPFGSGSFSTGAQGSALEGGLQPDSLELQPTEPRGTAQVSSLSAPAIEAMPLKSSAGPIDPPNAESAVDPAVCSASSG